MSLYYELGPRYSEVSRMKSHRTIKIKKITKFQAFFLETLNRSLNFWDVEKNLGRKFNYFLKNLNFGLLGLSFGQNLKFYALFNVFELHTTFFGVIWSHT